MAKYFGVIVFAGNEKTSIRSRRARRFDPLVGGLSMKKICELLLTSVKPCANQDPTMWYTTK